MAPLGKSKMLISSFLLLAITPITLAEQLPTQTQNAPPATFLETFTPVPSELATTLPPELLVGTTSSSPSSSPSSSTSSSSTSSSTYVSVQDNVVFLYEGLTPDRPQKFLMGDVKGSIIAVEATATTYELKCNTNHPDCDKTNPSITYTRGPSTIHYAVTKQASGTVATYTTDCPSGTSPFSCVETTEISIMGQTSYSTTSTSVFDGVTRTVSDAMGTYVDNGVTHGTQIPITAGIEKYLAFTSTHTATSSAGTTETSSSGAGSLRTDAWVLVFTIISMACMMF